MSRLPLPTADRHPRPSGFVGACLFTFLAIAMFYLEACLFFFPAAPPILVIVIFALLTFAALASAEDFDAAFGRACFVFAGLWLLLYPIGSVFRYLVTIDQGGQEVMVRHLSRTERLVEEVILGVASSLTTGWLPAAVTGICLALGICTLWSRRSEGRETAK